LERKEPLFWEHEGNRAVRDGDWKLVARGATGSWQLYNLKDDPSELTDLVEDHPERVAEMSGMWGAWASRAGVLPLTPYWPKPEEETNNGNERARPAAQPAAVPKVTTAAP
jgi:arylsulfatase A-like enzyme